MRAPRAHRQLTTRISNGSVGLDQAGQALGVAVVVTGRDAPVEARDGALGRRGFLRSLGVGAVGLSLFDTLSLHADELRKARKACILLWMSGGPSQTDTFDLKPGHANGGPFQPIATSVPGIVRATARWADGIFNTILVIVEPDGGAELDATLSAAV